MDIPWGDERSGKFVTNVGLITSNGPHGQNIMAAEWTHHVSYSPGLIAINIHSHDATAENIEKTREFGVNLAAFDQSIASSISGQSSGKEVDKIAVLKGMGFEFYKAKKIGALMLKGAAMNAECRVVKSMPLGDHTMFVGEAIEASASDRAQLIFAGGRYWKFGENIQKPGQDTLDKISKLIEKYRKK